MIKMNAKIVFISMVLDKDNIKISFMLPALGTYVSSTFKEACLTWRQRNPDPQCPAQKEPQEAASRSSNLRLAEAGTVRSS